MQNARTMDRPANRRNMFSPAFSLTEKEEMIVKALRGIDDADNGRYRDSSKVFADLRTRYST